MIRLYSIIYIFTFLLVGCNYKSDENSLVLRTLFIPTTRNIISLKKDTILNKYFLKDNYNLYTLESFFSKKNNTYNGGELELLKDTYSNHSTGNGFVIKYFTKDFLSYTFLEYNEKKIIVKYFVEIVNTDEKIIVETKSLNDTISKLTSKKIDIDANAFFSESFDFNTKHSNINYNFLNRKSQWILHPKSRQEKWASIHFLYETE